MIIKSRAPVRIYFGGGGTDISPYTEEYGGAVLNTAISKHAYTTLRTNEENKIEITSADYNKTITVDHISHLDAGNNLDNLDLIKAIIKKFYPEYGFEIFLRGDIMPNSGLGNSASTAVSIISLFNYLNKNKLNNKQIAELAFQIETNDLKNVGGRQDQYAASFGGFNLMEFKGNDNVIVKQVNIKKETVMELQKRLVLAFIGKREPSGNILKSQQDSYSKRDKIELLDYLKKNTYLMHDYLKEEKFEEFGKLLSNSWEKKVELNPNITTQKIEALRDIASKHGAIGSRNMGAGRGGHMIFFCREGREHNVRNAIEQSGAKIVDFNMDNEGVQVW